MSLVLEYLIAVLHLSGSTVCLCYLKAIAFHYVALYFYDILCICLVYVNQLI